VIDIGTGLMPDYIASDTMKWGAEQGRTAVRITTSATTRRGS
jgi:hypothetical protein